MSSACGTNLAGQASPSGSDENLARPTHTLALTGGASSKPIDVSIGETCGRHRVRARSLAKELTMQGAARYITFRLVALAAMALPSALAAADGAALPARSALTMAEAAVSLCQSLGHPVVAVVSSPEGLVRVQFLSDDAHPIDVASARRKAATAAMTGHATSAAAAIAKEAPAYGPLLTTLFPDALAIGGGVPILSDSHVIGAIGVAGAPGGPIDERCALAGIAAVTRFHAGK